MKNIEYYQHLLDFYNYLILNLLKYIYIMPLGVKKKFGKNRKNAVMYSACNLYCTGLDLI